MLIQKTVDETGVWESGAGGANKVTSHCQLPREGGVGRGGELSGHLATTASLSVDEGSPLV